MKLKKGYLLKKVCIVVAIGIVALIIGGFIAYQIIGENELRTYQLVSIENNSEGFIANYPQTVEEAMEQSELVVRCKIASKGDTYFVSRVNDEDKNRYQEDGAKEWQYSDVWTDCRLEVKEIYKGKCDSTIDYKFLGGKIGEYTENKEKNIFCFFSMFKKRSHTKMLSLLTIYWRSQKSKIL